MIKVSTFINSQMLRPFSILLIVGVIGVFPDSHSLRYYYTGVSGTGWGLPEFSILGYVDDQQIENYDSKTRLSRPVASWMNKEGPEYWDISTQMGRESESVFRENLRTAMYRYNQTEGLHSAQMMYGCELGDNGDIWVYSQYGYDGKDFIYLDTKYWNYIASVPEAQISAQTLNNPEVQQGKMDKDYLWGVCIGSLKEYINYGRDDLEKRVPPEVKVSGRQSDGVTKLRCWVYGFYPRDVDVKWMKDDIDEVFLDEANHILPNPDGTYQTRVGVEVAAGEEQRYSCHVDHSSLEETLIVKWEPKGDVISSVILAVICGLVLTTAAIAGIYTLHKRIHAYRKTCSSDISSNNSFTVYTSQKSEKCNFLLLT